MKKHNITDEDRRCPDALCDLNRRDGVWNRADFSDGGEDLYFLPADLEFLDMTDKRAEGILGEWSDESGNTYKFDEDKSMEIGGESGKTEGTYSVVEDANGTRLLRIVVSGGSLEYELL